MFKNWPKWKILYFIRNWHPHDIAKFLRSPLTEKKPHDNPKNTRVLSTLIIVGTHLTVLSDQVYIGALWGRITQLKGLTCQASCSRAYSRKRGHVCGITTEQESPVKGQLWFLHLNFPDVGYLEWYNPL